MCVPSLLPPRTLRSRTDLLPLLPRAQGAGAWRTDFVSSGPVPDTVNTLHTAVGISNVTAYEVSVMDIWPRSSTQWSNDTGASCLGDVLSTNASTASACYRLASSVPSDGKLDAVKYVGIASSDAFPGKELETALTKANLANTTGWDAILESHRAAWDAVWDDADIEIPGEENQELQIATRASLFHILTNVRPTCSPPLRCTHADDDVADSASRRSATAPSRPASATTRSLLLA